MAEDTQARAHAQMRAERAARVEAQKQADARRKLTLAEKADKGVALTIDELAEATGNKFRLGPGLAIDGRSEPTFAFSPEHLAAAQLHGWTLHAHHDSEPLRLIKIDYEAALDAANGTEPTLTPHLTACSKHSPNYARAEAAAKAKG